jgi:hypothetical protein
MATLIDWNALSQKIKSYERESPYCNTPRRAFSYMMLEYLINISQEERCHYCFPVARKKSS